MITTRNISFAVIALLATAWVNAGTGDNEIEKLVGKPLSKITMKSTSGNSFTNADFKGKVVLIDFWATWCGPCVKASPIMQKLHVEFKDKGLIVIGANTFEEDSSGAPAKEYAAEHKYTYLFTYDNDALAKKWGIQGIPTFVLVDSTGKVAKTYTGFGDSSEKEMRDAIKKLLPK